MAVISRIPNYDRTLCLRRGRREKIWRMIKIIAAAARFIAPSKTSDCASGPRYRCIICIEQAAVLLLREHAAFLGRQLPDFSTSRRMNDGR
jgi:hypothetical protein